MPRRPNILVFLIDDLDLERIPFYSRLDAGAAAQKSSQAEAARRIGRLDDTQIAAAKNAATGLAKARQYGLDRYPAIVVNGRAVLYGVTDLADAAQRYGAWLEARSR